MLAITFCVFNPFDRKMWMLEARFNRFGVSGRNWVINIAIGPTSLQISWGE